MVIATYIIIIQYSFEKNISSEFQNLSAISEGSELQTNLEANVRFIEFLAQFQTVSMTLRIFPKLSGLFSKLMALSFSTRYVCQNFGFF